MSVLIFAETERGKFKKDALELASYGCSIADEIKSKLVAICINSNNPEELSKYGVDKIICVNNNDLENFNPKNFSECISKIFLKEKSQFLILSSSSNSRYIGGMLSISTKAAYVSNVFSKPTKYRPLQLRRNSFTNKAFETVEVISDKVIISLCRNSYGIIENKVKSEVVSETFKIANNDILVSSTEKLSDKVSIADADIVVSGGRGLKGPENWHIIENLADVLGAATACSKPVSDSGWRPHSEHVGQTGKPVASNLYIAIGISGAIQHLAGINSSKIKVVINTDPDAPFFKSADYGIVGDAFEVVPELIEKLKKFKSLNN